MVIAFSSKIDYLCFRVIQLCEVWGIRLIDFRNQFVTHPFLSLILQFVNQRDSLNGNNQYIKVSCCDRCVDGYGCRLERNFAVRTMLGADRQSVRIRHLHMNGHVQVSVLIGYRIVDNDCQGTYRIRAWDMHPNPMLFASCRYSFCY